MLTTLAKYGDQTVLVLEQAILEKLHLDVDTLLNLETEGDTLIVSPVRNAEHHQKFRDALEQVNQQYGKMLKRLAE